MSHNISMWVLAIGLILVANWLMIYALSHSLKGYIMAAIEELTAAVTELESVIDSAIALINGIADEIDNCPDDEALAALTARLRAQAAELAAAVAANTAPPVDVPVDEDDE